MLTFPDRYASADNELRFDSKALRLATLVLGGLGRVHRGQSTSILESMTRLQ
jgi:hypothetical protein